MTVGFRVIAIISAFNEADILDQVLDHLLAEEVEVYLLDDGSTDGTFDVASSRQGRGVVGVERLKPTDDGRFSWARILERKQSLSTSLEADWFIHHDADEFRETPWEGVTLRRGCELVSSLGYNAIAFRAFNFRPTGSTFDPGVPVSTAFEYYEPAQAFDSLQVKAWRKQPSVVDLVSSGGHSVAFDERRVFPFRFLLRHYPIRDHVHGQRKVLIERLPRFDSAERARGWHLQYDGLAHANAFIWDARTLVRYDRVAVKESLAAAADLDQAHGRLVEALARSRQETHVAESIVATLQGQLRATERARDAALDAGQRIQRDFNRSEQRTSVLAHELKTHADTIAGLSQQIMDLHRSKSWRITAPLRATYRIMTAAGPPARSTEGDVPLSTVPLSHRWGLDRGVPVDRHYIHAFLNKHRGDVGGRVLEVKDGGYARWFGGDQVVDLEVLDVDAANEQATVIGDLSQPGSIRITAVDCFILTQTLHIIYDVRAAVRHAIDLLATGGVVLCTIPAVSRVSDEDGGLEGGDYWRMTRAAVRALFLEVLPESDFTVETHGNLRTCTAFLTGLATCDLTQAELDFDDPWFPLIHCVRGVKR